MLRDIDQPFIFEIKLGARPYRLEFYDNNSPDSWKLLDPDVVVICYDISQRLSLINTRRVVSGHRPPYGVSRTLMRLAVVERGQDGLPAD